MDQLAQDFDVIVIGGGATGLGIALEAITRGYRTLLLEAQDYGKGTSSKSTKLVHGGIRYLANFDFALVEEGLEERFYFLNNAPHISHRQSYLIPLKNWREKCKYWLGIKIYDYLAAKRKIGQSRFLNKAQTLQAAPDLKATKVSASAIYYDGQFDDTRMLVALLKTFEEHGGVAKNYHKVVNFLYTQTAKVNGVICQDQLTQQQQQFTARFVINACGTFSDSLMDLAEPEHKHQTVAAAQGTHLVFDKHVFACEHAILVPETSDGRVLFILPWHDKVLVGTTDIKVAAPALEPQIQEQEIDFILATLNEYSQNRVSRSDIKARFCGQRPLVKPANSTNSAKISRKHEIFTTANGLITMVGGKWTIYRRMGQDTLDYIEKTHALPRTLSITRTLHLFGYSTEQLSYPLSVYGSAAAQITAIQHQTNNYAKLHHELPYLQAEVIYQVRHEQAKTVEDVLARRTRALFLNQQAALEAAPLVADLIAAELNYDQLWVKNQLENLYLAYTNT